MNTRPLFTIGHSTRSIEDFLQILREHKIEAVADVRSQPYSRRFPQFSRKALEAALREAGIRYVFLGRELGARREERECYVDGQARYDLVAETVAFKRGIQRVITGASKYRVALMCAEKDPLTCHRTILVCRQLEPLGFYITHIIDSRETESHQAAEQRLMAEERINPNQIEMFGTNSGEATPLNRAYAARGEKIAYRESEKSDEDLHDRVYPEER